MLASGKMDSVQVIFDDFSLMGLRMYHKPSIGKNLQLNIYSRSSFISYIHYLRRVGSSYLMQLQIAELYPVRDFIGPLNAEVFPGETSLEDD